MISRPVQITDRHLRRKAIVYVRQSSPQQVREAVGSTAVQRDLASKLVAWGWDPTMIEVVEELGVSGSWTGTRDEFNRLLERIRADEIGLVADVDSSRLSRNDFDFFLFADVARRRAVLLAHGDQIIDFTDPNSAFIGGILGLNATRENRVRIQLSVQARLKKVEAGIAPTAPGIGYVRRPGGEWVKDADPQVRQVLALVLDKGFEIGSIRGVVRYFRTHQIQVPRRRRKGIEPSWQDASYGVIAGILKNPVYAGRYIYGRTVLEPPAEGSRKKGRQRPQPPSAWRVIEQHHEPYVGLARWTQIQEQIAANRRTVSPPAGRGEALVQGRLRCTLHGSTFQTVYDTRSQQSDGQIRRRARYLCRPGRETADPLEHQSIRALRMDTVIERVLLETLSPVALEGIQEAVRLELRQYEGLQRGRQDELRRAQQAVAEAERSYVQADPAHVHLKGRLAERAEQALRDLEDLQARHRLNPLIPPMTLEDATLAELRQLVSNLPQLWRHPSVTPEQRKAIVRAVIKVIHVTPATEAWPLEIEWVSGARMALSLTPADRVPVRSASRPAGERRTRRAIDPGAYPFIRERAVIGMAIPAIVEALNAAGTAHPRGVWRIQSVNRAIVRLRRGEVPGVDALPAPPTLTDRVRALHHQGYSPAEIVAQLRSQGVQTRHQTLVTREAVYKTLERLGLPTHFVVVNQAIREHLRAWGSAATAGEIATRLNGLGFTTKLSRPWTLESVREKLRDLGIPFARCRRAPAPVVDAAEGVTPGVDE